MCTQLQIAVSAVANTTGERECGALGVRSQREGWNGENDFASTTFYFFVSVECKKYFIGPLAGCQKATNPTGMVRRDLSVSYEASNVQQDDDIIEGGARRGAA